MLLGWEEQKNELFSELITSSDLSNMLDWNPDSLTLAQKDLSVYSETELKWSHAWCVHTEIVEVLLPAEHNQAGTLPCGKLSGFEGLPWNSNLTWYNL